MTPQKYPQYLHRKYRIWIFEQDELVILLLGMVGGIFFSLWSIPCGIAASLWLRATRDRRSRGYILHWLLRIGLISMKGYPDTFAREFHE